VIALNKLCRLFIAYVVKNIQSEMEVKVYEREGNTKESVQHVVGGGVNCVNSVWGQG
jgi:hypothetical protein